MQHQLQHPVRQAPVALQRRIRRNLHLASDLAGARPLLAQPRQPLDKLFSMMTLMLPRETSL